MARPLVRLVSGVALGSLLCLGSIVLPAGHGSALAAEMKAADAAKAKQAKRLYKDGEYENAAKIFSELSSEYPTMLVFTRNLGACYYYLRRPGPALSNLREYLQRSKNVTPDDRSEVERWMAEMEQLLAPPVAPVASVAPEPAPAPVPAAPVPAPNPPPTAAPPPTSEARTELATPAIPVAPPPATGAGSGLRVAGIAVGGVGLASIAAGIYFYTRASSLSDEISAADTPSASDFKSGKNAETMQWVCYGLGAAALATGSVLYYLGWQAGHAGSVAVAPAVAPGFAGLSAQGAF